MTYLVEGPIRMVSWTSARGTVQLVWRVGFIWGACENMKNHLSSNSSNFQGAAETSCFFQGQLSFFTIRGTG